MMRTSASRRRHFSRYSGTLPGTMIIERRSLFKIVSCSGYTGLALASRTSAVIKHKDCRPGSDRHQTAIWRSPLLQRQAPEDIRYCVAPMPAAASGLTANGPLQTTSRGLLVLARFPTLDEEWIQ